MLGVREARKRWCLHEKSELVDEQKLVGDQELIVQ